MKKKTFILLGATGNLAELKIYPALAALVAKEYLREDFQLIGAAKDNLSEEEFCESVKQKTEGKIQDASYVVMDFLNDSFESLAERTSESSELYFYLSVSPVFFKDILGKIRSCRAFDGKDVKIILEKPYGINYRNTVMVNQYIKEFIGEKQVYRIDHYLGKEGIEEIERLKKEKSSLWNSTFIDEITIILAETAGIESRIDFYKETGAIADVVQNHIFQLILTLLKTDHYSREEALEDLFQAFIKKRAWFNRKAYLDIDKETLLYGEVVLLGTVWQGVKLKLMTGKKMAEKRTEIRITFKGEKEPAVIDFLKKDKNRLPEYSLLILDAMKGSHKDFVSADLAEATWKFGDYIRESLCSKESIEKYQEGTVTAESLLTDINRRR